MINATMPVKVGDIVEINISSIGRRGDGVAKIGNYIIFVPRGSLDHTYHVRITDVHDTFAFGIISSGGR